MLRILRGLDYQTLVESQAQKTSPLFNTFSSKAAYGRSAGTRNYDFQAR